MPSKRIQINTTIVGLMISTFESVQSNLNAM